jgi:SsrA-binding protein
MTKREKNTRHLLTICTQEASRFSKGSRRSRCCGQAGNSLRASAKVLAAAGNAVKLATACALQQRFLPQPVMRSSWLQLAFKGVPLSSRQQLVSSIPLDYICKLCITRKTRKNDMAKKVSKSDFISTGLVAQNRRANFDYQIDKVYVAGLELTGTEVKSLRLGHANINDAYGIEKSGELFISNMFIAEYANKGYESHAEKRDRKLLLLHKEICEIISELSRKGSTLVAMKLFFNDRGRAKLEIGLGRGKKLYDKRETIKDRDWNRDRKRILINANH